MTHTEHHAIEALALEALRALEPSSAPTPDDAQPLDRDYYALLGVAIDADHGTIQSALDAMLRDNPPLARRTALHNAGAVLLTPDLRARYNATL